MHEEFIRSTVEWLNRRVAPEGVTVDADTRLFDAGVVDSLGILRLIAWTERAIGRRIPDREVRMDRFASVRVIADNFVGPARTSGEKRGCGGKGDCARCALRRRAA